MCGLVNRHCRHWSASEIRSAIHDGATLPRDLFHLHICPLCGLFPLIERSHARFINGTRACNCCFVESWTQEVCLLITSRWKWEESMLGENTRHVNPAYFHTTLWKEPWPHTAIKQCWWAQWQRNKTNYSDKWGRRQVCQQKGRMLHLPKARPLGMADGYFNFLSCEELGGGRGTRRAQTNCLWRLDWTNHGRLAKLDSLDGYSQLPGQHYDVWPADSHV